VIVRAKYGLLAPGEVRRDVRLEIDGERIVSVSSGYTPGAMRPDYDFPDGVIIPGLVNAHTHLELEFCAHRVPYNGCFVDWLQRIRDLKRIRGSVTSPAPRASLRGLAAAGCTTVLDHHTSELNWEAINECGLRYLAFRELFQFDNHAPDINRLRLIRHDSFAPHASYTASIEIAKAARLLADEQSLPVSMHLSEIKEELSFIRDGESETIRRLLEMAQAYDTGWCGSGSSPIAYFAANGILNQRSYTVHVNYLDEGDLEILADLKPTVVFCPRSHAFFGHEDHPAGRYLEAGVPLALGTDSLASNDRLSPLYEAALVREKYPEVSAADLFAAITGRALGPLGWETELGKLEPGCLGDFAIFELNGDPAAALPKEERFAALFDAVIEREDAILTVMGGNVIHVEELQASAAY
jgi:aminodeoxyfutalosine deaminase